MKVEVRSNAGNKLLATGKVSKGGKVEWSGDRATVLMLSDMFIAPDEKGHLDFVSDYLARSTTMTLVKVR